MSAAHHAVMASARGGNAGLGLVGNGAMQAGANPTVPVPANVVAGDLLVILGGTNGTFTSTLTGWTNDTVNGGGGLSVWHKWAAGGDAAPTVTVSGASTNTVMVAFRGWSTLDLVGTPVSTATTVAANGITTTATGDLVLSLYAGTTNASTWTATPSGTVVAFDSAGAGGRALLMCYESWPTANATGTRSATNSGGGIVGGIVIGFKP